MSKFKVFYFSIECLPSIVSSVNINMRIIFWAFIGSTLQVYPIDIDSVICIMVIRILLNEHSILCSSFYSKVTLAPIFVSTNSRANKNVLIFVNEYGWISIPKIFIINTTVGELNDIGPRSRKWIYSNVKFHLPKFSPSWKDTEKFAFIMFDRIFVLTCSKILC